VRLAALVLVFRSTLILASSEISFLSHLQFMQMIYCNIALLYGLVSSSIETPDLFEFSSKECVSSSNRSGRHVTPIVSSRQIFDVAKWT
jgi:hypothetical protein